jgi:hypothetical protein
VRLAQRHWALAPVWQAPLRQRTVPMVHWPRAVSTASVGLALLLAPVGLAAPVDLAVPVAPVRVDPAAAVPVATVRVDPDQVGQLSAVRVDPVNTVRADPVNTVRADPVNPVSTVRADPATRGAEIRNVATSAAPPGATEQLPGDGARRRGRVGAGRSRRPAGVGPVVRSTTGATRRHRSGTRGSTSGASTSSEFGSRCKTS